MTQPVPDPAATPFSSPLNAPWAQFSDIPESAKAGIDLGDVDEWDNQLWIASELLFAFTGRRWRAPGGRREVVVRSMAPAPGHGLDWAYHPSWGRCRCWTFSTLDAGGPRSARGWSGGHASRRAIRLPDPDVSQVRSVTLDDELVEDWTWDGDWLRRTDGRDWPVCGNKMAVAYDYGLPPPRGGVSVAWRLAVEYARHAVSDEKCRLPSRITSITRQNIAMTFGAPEDVAKSRLTGVPPFDSWIVSVNPSLRPAEAIVVSPDVPTGR